MRSEAVESGAIFPPSSNRAHAHANGTADLPTASHANPHPAAASARPVHPNAPVPEGRFQEPSNASPTTT